MTAENDTKMDGKSLDITKENIAALGMLFPEIVTEDGVDLEKLKLIIGEIDCSDKNERYEFTWHGKSKAIRLSQIPSIGTLRPCRKDSREWDKTNNIYIKGDNLECLKLLQKSYRSQIKMIYIDPPYNRKDGKEVIYKDDFSDNIANYLRITGQLDEDDNPRSTEIDREGRLHTNWLNMMYPRLRLARNLLMDNGVIFISIDDDEIENLKKICNEIFGQNNELATLIWNKQHSQQQGIFKNYHEYVLVYAKNIESLQNIRGGSGIIEAGALKKISKSNPASNFTFPAGVRFDAPNGTELNGTFGNSEKVTVVSGNMICDNGKLKESVTLSAGWTQKSQMMQFFHGSEPVFDSKGQRVIEFFFNSKGKIKCLKERSSITPSTLLPEFGMSSKHTEELSKLLGGNYFENPKPIDLIETFINWFVEDNDTVLDFFSGSGTTAHALFRYNLNHRSSCKFILVQLPEKCKEDSDAYKGGYKNLCEIGMERIRRAGDEIKALGVQTKIGDMPKHNMDVGFKVFELDSSNVKKWNPSGDLKHTLLEYENNIVSDSGRTNLDIVYEIMLKMGLELTSKIDVIENNDVTLYSISSGALMICLDDIKDTAVAEEMISIYKEQSPFVWKVVFKDNGFASDDVKANTRETLKMAGLPEGSFVTL